MRRLAFLFTALAVASGAQAAEPRVAIAIHGGAGTMSRAALTPEAEKAIRADLDRALDAGHQVLVAGGPALDAVEAAVRVLEDSPRFNAGRGAVYNAEGVNEMDAAIMDGHSLAAGAVAGVHRVRNPIGLARAVMEKSRHVMLVGDGAEAFGRSVGIEMVEPSYFGTEHRRRQLEEAQAKERAQPRAALPASAYFGTVGAVALDAEGHTAAATSTGGMTNKRWGRVGDAPIIGAGTYAAEDCAVSATGWGEFFIRLAVAYDICARAAYRGDSVAEAATEVVMRRVPGLGGDGGVIAIDGQGRIAQPFNTPGMYRGWIAADGSRGTAIFADAEE
ncbi:isoaspartyl peptidase/L-asparaginase family protein [Coralloluteibacterium stylophorae]|uniref:Isoaspartyl peptidase n=1 Tax=Coralloluteibacterium stylophorae TaxID=1776034 RepID=A0A8J8AY23_9GAMM|nr:isoaspartyl peptidase/L-asparaginase [Coralloluteibacterium stylophorae]MBS7456108.1 isoaspartyl peptidase/L-asparaginase [Coralloluteibacterium stylophorae]